MADTKAIAFVESIYRRTDQQVRDILATAEGGAEVDSINVIIGDGATAIVAGVAAALRVDFRARITGMFLQEFDGTSGSITVNIQRAVGGAAPSWATISPTTAAGISSGRYYADESVSTWQDTYLDRGDYLRFVVASASTITRVHLALRLRRLEP
jgi:hypothetical protein